MSTKKVTVYDDLILIRKLFFESQKQQFSYV